MPLGKLCIWADKQPQTSDNHFLLQARRPQYEVRHRFGMGGAEHEKQRQASFTWVASKA